MTRPTISGVSPFFIVADVPAALSFYRDMLGFEVTFRGPTPEDEFFGIVRRDGATIMFKALGVISDGKEVIVEPVPNYNREPAFWMLILWSLMRTRWRRSSPRVAFLSARL